MTAARGGGGAGLRLSQKDRSARGGDVAIGRALEPRERESAKAREKAPLKRGTKRPAVESCPSGKKGKARDKVGRSVGLSGRTYEKAKAYRKAGELIKAGQEAGTIATKGRPGKCSAGEHLTVLPELGIARKQSHRWQIEAVVPEKQFREYVQAHPLPRGEGGDV